MSVSAQIHVDLFRDTVTVTDQCQLMVGARLGSAQDGLEWIGGLLSRMVWRCYCLK